MKKTSLTILLLTIITIAFGQTDSAEIKFEHMVHDFGTIEFGGDGSTNFIFTNTGKAPLLLNNVKSTCGCTVPEWPKTPIAPGQSDTIKVVYNTHRSGAFNKGIIVYTNTSTESIRLIIKGVVEAQANKPVLGETR